jgi:DNA (cytosine-5)-methyltransferase 1
MRVLDLFAGAGGAAWTGKLLGWTTVCYVERDRYCQQVLRQRIADGVFDDAPIFDDVRIFDGREWEGAVDLVCGGFPCQPFSTASRGRIRAEDLWPEMLRIVREAMPSLVFAENVQREPIASAARDLCELGYRGAITRACPASMGAAHRRRRWWLLAYTDDAKQCGQSLDAAVASVQAPESFDAWGDPGQFLGVAHGVADRGHRIRALGNGWVPLVAATAFCLLTRRAGLWG